MIKIPKLDRPTIEFFALVAGFIFQIVVPLAFNAIIVPLDPIEDHEIINFLFSYHLLTSFVGLIVIVIIIVLTCKSIIKFLSAVLIITCLLTILNCFLIIISGTNFFIDCFLLLYCLIMPATKYV